MVNKQIPLVSALGNESLLPLSEICVVLSDAGESAPRYVTKSHNVVTLLQLCSRNFHYRTRQSLARYWNFSFIVSELVQVNADNSLVECVDLYIMYGKLAVVWFWEATGEQDWKLNCTLTSKKVPNLMVLEMVQICHCKQINICNSLLLLILKYDPILASP